MRQSHLNCAIHMDNIVFEEILQQNRSIYIHTYYKNSSLFYYLSVHPH